MNVVPTFAGPHAILRPVITLSKRLLLLQFSLVQFSWLPLSRSCDLPQANLSIRVLSFRLVSTASGATSACHNSRAVEGTLTKLRTELVPNIADITVSVQTDRNNRRVA
jgi:hypothetical protein